MKQEQYIVLFIIFMLTISNASGMKQGFINHTEKNGLKITKDIKKIRTIIKNEVHRSERVCVPLRLKYLHFFSVTF